MPERARSCLAGCCRVVISGVMGTMGTERGLAGGFCAACFSSQGPPGDPRIQGISEEAAWSPCKQGISGGVPGSPLSTRVSEGVPGNALLTRAPAMPVGEAPGNARVRYTIVLVAAGGSFRQGPGQNEKNDGSSAATFERARTFIERSAGSHHVIDQKNGLVGKRGFTAERSADVFLALPPGQSGLRGRVADALAQRGYQRAPEPGRQRAGEFEGLVKTAFAQPRRVQGKRRNQVSAENP